MLHATSVYTQPLAIECLLMDRSRQVLLNPRIVLFTLSTARLLHLAKHEFGYTKQRQPFYIANISNVISNVLDESTVLYFLPDKLKSEFLLLRRGYKKNEIMCDLFKSTFAQEK